MLWHWGHFWMTIAGAFLCVLRARFFRLEVRRLGTAMGVDYVKRVEGAQDV